MPKRSAFALISVLAVAIVSAPAIANPGSASAVTPATTRQVAMGASMRPFDTATGYDGFVAQMGRAPAAWSVWADWGGAANPSAFPGALVDRLQAHGTTPLIFWQPVGGARPPGHPNSPPLQEACGTAFDKIIGGDWDNYIHSWAQAAKGRGTILIRFAHEMDGTWYPYSISKCGNTNAKFRVMWDHVVKIFRADGATNVKFVWSPTRATKDRTPMYPGTGWVDYIGVTNYNWAASKNLPWQSLLTLMQKSFNGTLSFAADKKWIVAETGSPATPGDRPSWLTTGYKAVYNAFPNIALIMYFNVDMRGVQPHHPNWQLNTSADINAYRSLLNDVRFQGTIN